MYAQRPYQGLPFLNTKLYIYIYASSPKKNYYLDYTN